MSDTAAGNRTGAALRILTLNAHQGLGGRGRGEALLQIREGLRRTAPDLVFLQEIGSLGPPGAAEHQYEILADQAWPEYAYGRNAVTTGGHHGNAILSRHPIATWENVDASVGRAEARGFLHCVISVHGALCPLHAICLHLALRESHRHEQVARLIELVTDRVPGDAALVIAGDFNDWRQRAHRRLIAALELEEAHAAAFGSPARTFPARWPVLRLDRIYVRNLRHRPWSLHRAPWAALSDHAPLGAELLPGD